MEKEFEILTIKDFKKSGNINAIVFGVASLAAITRTIVTGNVSSALTGISSVCAMNALCDYIIGSGSKDTLSNEDSKLLYNTQIANIIIAAISFASAFFTKGEANDLFDAMLVTSIPNIINKYDKIKLLDKIGYIKLHDKNNNL